MLQRTSVQSTQEASQTHEREGQQQKEATLAAVGRVAKGHVSVGDSLAQLSRAEKFATKAESRAEVEALQKQLSKAREELREAQKAAAEMSPQKVEEEDEEEEDPKLALAQSTTAEADPLDLADLLLLAAATDDHINLTEAAMAEIGWTPGVLVKFEQGQFKDHAWTFRKGNRCLATFAATNDMVDVEQVLTYDPMDFCGFSEVHSGLVGELVGFMQSPEWPDFIEFMNDPTCETVTAAGHSLGGALATLFVASANRGCDLFGSRDDYSLVTYAPFAISKKPLFNKRRGRDFVGTRYGITELDGGFDGTYALPPPEVLAPWRTQVLTFFAFLSEATGDNSSAVFARQMRKLERRGIDAVRWNAVEQAAVPLLTTLRYILTVQAPGMEVLHTKALELIYVSVQGGALNYAHDPISTLSSYRNTGVKRGYTHPLQAFQPLANPLKAPPNTVLERVSGVDAPDLPHGDFFQDHLGIIASGVALPNHQACCYSTVPNCAHKFVEEFFVASKECVFSPLR